MSSLEIHVANFFHFNHQHDELGESWLIDWCLMPTLAVFQLYRGMNKYIGLIHQQDP
jgi:hypothetical protein